MFASKERERMGVGVDEFFKEKSSPSSIETDCSQSRQL
jgi:hypothetical protein